MKTYKLARTDRDIFVDEVTYGLSQGKKYPDAFNQAKRKMPYVEMTIWEVSDELARRKAEKKKRTFPRPTGIKWTKPSYDQLSPENVYKLKQLINENNNFSGSEELFNKAKLVMLNEYGFKNFKLNGRRIERDLLLNEKMKEMKFSYMENGTITLQAPIVAESNGEKWLLSGEKELEFAYFNKQPIKILLVNIENNMAEQQTFGF